MKTLFAFLILFAGFGMPVSAGDTSPGSLIVVTLEDGKKTVEGTVGDLIQFEVDYPVVPDRIVDNLKVEIGCKGLTYLATARVQKLSPEGKPVLGVGGIAAFVRLDKAGDQTLKITPHLANGKDGPAIEITVKVAAKQ